MHMRKTAMCAALSAALVMGTGVAAAAPIVAETFAMRLQNSANANNLATGDILFWGANSVTPAASTYAFTRQCPVGADCSGGPSDPDYVRQSLFWRPFTLRPDQYFASRAYDPNLTGAWTLVTSSSPTFASGTNTVVNTAPVGNAALMPYVASMSVQGAGLTPTITWELPTTGPSVDAVRVRFFDLDQQVVSTSRRTFNGVLEDRSFSQADFVFERVLAPSVNSFALQSSDLQLQYGRHYSIAVTLDHQRANGSVESRSQSFFDFTPINPAGLPEGAEVYLPIATPVPTTSGLVGSGGVVYNFSIGEVGPEKVTFIDPLVAAGYTYEKGAADANFKSVQIVTNAGDGLYDVQIWNGTAWVTVRTGLGVGETFDFVLDGQDADGVEKFQIVGIETDAGLNPFDLTAFVTGLSFMTQGTFTGTMSPIIVDVPDAAVPLPGTLLLLGAGIFGLGAVRRSKSVSPRWF